MTSEEKFIHHTELVLEEYIDSLKHAPPIDLAKPERLNAYIKGFVEATRMWTLAYAEHKARTPKAKHQ